MTLKEIQLTIHQSHWSDKIKKNWGMLQAHKVIAGKPEGKRQVGRRGRGWEDNIKINRTKWCEDKEWIHLAQGRVQRQVHVNTVVTAGSMKHWVFFTS
jgi:hypothetical protein